jgi:hypothetical protein
MWISKEFFLQATKRLTYADTVLIQQKYKNVKFRGGLKDDAGKRKWTEDPADDKTKTNVKKKIACDAKNCSRKFTKKSDMILHWRREHTDEIVPNFACDDKNCTKKFTRNTQMKVHWRREHSGDPLPKIPCRHRKALQRWLACSGI